MDYHTADHRRIPAVNIICHVIRSSLYMYREKCCFVCNSIMNMLTSTPSLKVALQILGRKCYKNVSFIKPQSRKPSDNKREMKFTTAQVDTDRNHGLFLHEKLAHLHTGNTQKKVSKTASDEDIMENNYIFVMLWNISVISCLIFPQCSF